MQNLFFLVLCYLGATHSNFLSIFRIFDLVNDHMLYIVVLYLILFLFLFCLKIVFLYGGSWLFILLIYHSPTMSSKRGRFFSVFRHQLRLVLRILLEQFVDYIVIFFWITDTIFSKTFNQVSIELMVTPRDLKAYET